MIAARRCAVATLVGALSSRKYSRTTWVAARIAAAFVSRGGGVADGVVTSAAADAVIRGSVCGAGEPELQPDAAPTAPARVSATTYRRVVTNTVRKVAKPRGG
jgi:hypothetical protein